MNYLTAIEEMYDSKDASILQNTFEMSAFSKKFGARVFAFRVGQK